MNRLAWVAMLSAAASAAVAQEIGHKDEGLAFAKQVCATCHAVERGAERSPKLDAPTFEEIAATPGITAAGLAAALQTSHATMPI